MSEAPAHDSGSATCEVRNMIMMKWVNSAIPLCRLKKSVGNAKHGIVLLALATCRYTWSMFGVPHR